MKKLSFLALFFFIVFLLKAKSPAATTTGPLFSDTPRMKQYWLVQLLRGNKRDQDKASAEKIQSGHIANIGRLHREGYLLMAGPMGDDKDWLGIFVMDAKDSATVAKLVETDPAVKAGRLRVEIYPWWVQTGTYIFK